MQRMADVANDPEKGLNRPEPAGFTSAPDAARPSEVAPVKSRRSEPAAIGIIILVWIAKFLSFSLERFLHESETQSWTMLGARAVVTVLGAVISFAILRLLQRGTGMPFVKRALSALGLALAGATAHSVLNTWVFTLFMGSPGTSFSAGSFGSLVYLFSWVYLAVTVILLSLTYGEELMTRERRIAELTDVHRAPQPPGRAVTEQPHLWLRKGGERVRVDVTKIDWVAAEGECVRLHCGADSFLERQSLTSVEEKLAPLGFARIHRSAVVNTDRIERLAKTPSGALRARLSTGAELRVSKSFQPAVRRLVQDRA